MINKPNFSKPVDGPNKFGVQKRETSKLPSIPSRKTSSLAAMTFGSKNISN